MRTPAPVGGGSSVGGTSSSITLSAFTLLRRGLHEDERQDRGRRRCRRTTDARRCRSGTRPRSPRRPRPSAPRRAWSGSTQTPSAGRPTSGRSRRRGRGRRPSTPPETTWVVESEKPKYDEARIVVELAVSAEKPCGAAMSVTLVPSVRITRQPPENVPSATATAQVTLTQVGHAGAGRELTAGDERQHDHAHRLLGVVRAVGERDQRAREDLAGAEPAGRVWRRQRAGQPVREPGGDQTRRARTRTARSAPGSAPSHRRRSRSRRPSPRRRAPSRSRRRPARATTRTGCPCTR